MILKELSRKMGRVYSWIKVRMNSFLHFKAGILGILLFLIIPFSSLKSQDFGYRFKPPGEEDNHLGLRGSLGLNGLKFKDIAPLPGSGAKNSLNPYLDLGIYYDSKFTNSFAAIVELNVATRPGKITFSDGSYTWTQYNAELPILIRYELIQDIYLYGGIGLGKMIKANITRIENAPLPFLDSTTNLLPTYTFLNASLIGGATYSLNEDFALDVRLIHGLTNLAKMDNPYKGLHFLSVEFGIRYNLPIGDKSSYYLRY
jgi:hypothetical protein